MAVVVEGGWTTQGSSFLDLLLAAEEPEPFTHKARHVSMWLVHVSVRWGKWLPGSH